MNGGNAAKPRTSEAPDDVSNTGTITAGSDAPMSSAMADPEGSAAAALGRRVLTVGLVAIVLIAYVFHAALPRTPVHLPFQNRAVVGLFLPQGWAFFTKSPRTAGIVAYRRTLAGWRSLSPGALAVPDDWMGIDRTRRAQGIEMAMIFRFVDKSRWRRCDGDPFNCVASSPTLRLVNDASNHTICGDVGFVRQPIRPWAWRDSHTVMPSLVLRAEVSCR